MPLVYLRAVLLSPITSLLSSLTFFPPSAFFPLVNYNAGYMTVTLKIPIAECQACRPLYNSMPNHIPASFKYGGKQPIAIMQRQKELETAAEKAREEVREDDAGNNDDELMFPIEDCGDAYVNMEGDSSLDKLLLAASMSSSFTFDPATSEGQVANEPSDAETVLDDDEPTSAPSIPTPSIPVPASSIPAPPSIPASSIPAPASSVPTPSITPASMPPVARVTIDKNTKFVCETSRRHFYGLGPLHKVYIGPYVLYASEEVSKSLEEAFGEVQDTLDASLHIVDSEDEREVREDVLFDVYNKFLIPSQIGIRGNEVVYFERAATADAVPLAARGKTVPLSIRTLTTRKKTSKPDTPVTTSGVDPQWIIQRLLRYGYKKQPVRGDGNCLYRAASLMIHGTDEHHAKVRALVYYSIHNESDYAHFRSFETTENIANGRRTGEMAGDMEIACIAKLYGYCFNVYGPDNRHIISHGDAAAPALYLIFSVAHYDAFTDGQFKESNVFTGHYFDNPEQFYDERMPREYSSREYMRYLEFEFEKRKNLADAIKSVP